MKTHRSYLHVIQKLTTAGVTVGMAHITGGGITENLPRILPKNCAAQIEIGSWPVLLIFDHLRDLGQVSEPEMLRTFNMGIGLIAAIPADKFTRAKNLLEMCIRDSYGTKQFAWNAHPGFHPGLFSIHPSGMRCVD